MTKTFILFGLVLALSSALIAQKNAVELDFEKNKARHTKEHFVSGEDATSGYDYLFYKRAGKIVHIRSIWSASYTTELRIEDFYFREGLAFLRRSKGNKRNYSALKSGRSAPLVSNEELHFADSKLVRWIEKGKVIDKTDTRWSETEKATLEHAKSELESYDFLKDND